VKVKQSRTLSTFVKQKNDPAYFFITFAWLKFQFFYIFISASILHFSYLIQFEQKKMMLALPGTSVADPYPDPAFQANPDRDPDPEF
jgi:hypothetical protein